MTCSICIVMKQDGGYAHEKSALILALIDYRSGLIKYKMGFKLLILIMIALVSKSRCKEEAERPSDSKVGEGKQQDDRYFNTLCHQCEKKQRISLPNHQMENRNFQTIQNKSYGKCFYRVFQKQPEKPSAPYKNNEMPFVDKIKDAYIWLNNLVLEFFKSSNKNENCIGCQKKMVFVTKDKQWKTSDLMHHTLDGIFHIYSYPNRCKNPKFFKQYRKKRKFKIVQEKSRNTNALMLSKRAEKQAEKIVLLASDETNYASGRCEINAAALLKHQAQASTFAHCSEGNNWFYKVASIFRLKSKIFAAKEIVTRIEGKITNLDQSTIEDMSHKKIYKSFERIASGRNCHFYTPMFSLICSSRKQFRSRIVSEIDDNSKTSSQQHNITSSATPINAGTLSERVIREGPSHRYFEHLMNKNSSIYYLPSNHVRCRQPLSVKRERTTENSTMTSITSKERDFKRIYTLNSGQTFHQLSNLLSLKCLPLRTKRHAHKVEKNVTVKNDTRFHSLKATQSLPSNTQKHDKSIRTKEEIFSLLSLCFLLVCKNPDMKSKTSQVSLKIPRMSEDEYEGDRSSKSDEIAEDLAVHVDETKARKLTKIVSTIVKEINKNEINGEDTKDRFSLEDNKSLVSVKGAESTFSSELTKSSTLIMNTESRTLLRRDEIVAPPMGAEIKPSFSSMGHGQKTITVALSNDKKIKQSLTIRKSQVTEKSSSSDAASFVQLDDKESKKHKKYEGSSLGSGSSSMPIPAITEDSLRYTASNGVDKIDQSADGKSSLLLSPTPSITLADDGKEMHLSAHVTLTKSLEMSKSSLPSKVSKIVKSELEMESSVTSRHQHPVSSLDILEKRSHQNDAESTAVSSNQPIVTPLKQSKTSAVFKMTDVESSLALDATSPSIVAQRGGSITNRVRKIQQVRKLSDFIDNHTISSKKSHPESSSPLTHKQVSFDSRIKEMAASLSVEVTSSIVTRKSESLIHKMETPQRLPESSELVDNHGKSSEIDFKSKNLVEEMPQIAKATETPTTESAILSKVKPEKLSKIVRSSGGTGSQIYSSVVQKPDVSGATATKTDHKVKSSDTTPKNRMNSEILLQFKSVTPDDKPRISSNVPICMSDTNKRKKVKSKEPLKKSYSGAANSEKLKTENHGESSETLKRSSATLVNVEKQQTTKSIVRDDISTVSSQSKVSFETHDSKAKDIQVNHPVYDKINTVSQQTEIGTATKHKNDRTSKQRSEDPNTVVYSSKLLPSDSGKISVKTPETSSLSKGIASTFKADVKSITKALPIDLQKEGPLELTESEKVVLTQTTAVAGKDYIASDASKDIISTASLVDERVPSKIASISQKATSRTLTERSLSERLSESVGQLPNVYPTKSLPDYTDRLSKKSSSKDVIFSTSTSVLRKQESDANLSEHVGQRPNVYATKSLSTYADKMTKKSSSEEKSFKTSKKSAFRKQQEPRIDLLKEGSSARLSESAKLLLLQTVAFNSKKGIDESVSDTTAGLSETSSLSRPQSQKDVALKLESSETDNKKSHKSRDEEVTDIGENFRHPFEPTKSFSETKQIVVKESSSKAALKESDTVGSKTSDTLLETGVQQSLDKDTRIFTNETENVENPSLVLKLSKDNVTRTETNDVKRESEIDKNKKPVISSAMKVIKSSDPLDDLPYHAQPSTMAVSDKNTVQDHKEEHVVAETAEGQYLYTKPELRTADTFGKDTDVRNELPEKEKEIEEGKIVAISPDFVVLATLAALAVYKLLKTSFGSLSSRRPVSNDFPEEATQPQPPEEPDGPPVMMKLPRLETTVAIADIFMKPDGMIGYEVRRSGKG